MRILITGGFGFVGGRLAIHLARAGHLIVIGTRNVTSFPAWAAQIEVLQIDWDDDDVLEQSCSGVDVLIHAAGMNAQDCAAHPVSALAFNGLATARLIAAASRAGVQRVIYLSTAHVYASPLVGTITEETYPRNLHPYATSHLAGEYAVLGESARGEIEGIVLRLSNAFGAPMHKDVNCWMLLVNDLCRQAVQTGKMILITNGLQERDFIGMAEVCSVIEHVVNLDVNAVPPGIFNVGAGVSMSVLEMANLIQQRCKVVLGFVPVLQLPEEHKHNNHISLIYRSERLAKIGVNMSLDKIAEIDRLLLFCHSSISQS
jgi:UDP-glucose 4-epimerase